MIRCLDALEVVCSVENLKETLSKPNMVGIEGKVGGFKEPDLAVSILNDK